MSGLNDRLNRLRNEWGRSDAEHYNDGVTERNRVHIRDLPECAFCELRYASRDVVVDGEPACSGCASSRVARIRARAGVMQRESTRALAAAGEAAPVSDGEDLDAFEAMQL